MARDVSGRETLAANAIALTVCALATALVAALTSVLLGLGAGVAARVGASVLLLALAHMIVLGLPLATMWLRARRLAWYAAVSGGFAIGVLPAALWSWPLWHARPGMSASDWNGHTLVPTMVNGVLTLSGWLLYGRLVLIAGAFGAIAGLVFWRVRRALLGVVAASQARG